MDKYKKDNQEHLFQCEQIKILVPELFNTTIKYEDIYSRNNKKIQNVAKLLEQIMNKKKLIS